MYTLSLNVVVVVVNVGYILLSLPAIATLVLNDEFYFHTKSLYSFSFAAKGTFVNENFVIILDES